MSNGHKLELISAGDGGAWLNYWDSITGHDWVWEIRPDGSVFRDDEDDNPQLVEDLARDILALLKTLQDGKQ